MNEEVWKTLGMASGMAKSVRGECMVGFTNINVSSATLRETVKTVVL